jgi:ribosomal protein S18 acetylase RimI-like enzyme
MLSQPILGPAKTFSPALPRSSLQPAGGEPSRRLLSYTDSEGSPLSSDVPEIIDIRRFGAQAFASLLAAESRVWYKSFHWDYHPSAEIISTCLEERRLSGYALVEEGRIRGYSFFFYEGAKGLIGNLYVEQEGTLKDGVHRLLDHVLETMLATPRLRRVETQLPHYSVEELLPSFRARGFRSFQRRFMAAPLEDPADDSPSVPGSPPARLSPDFLTVPWENKHDREAAQLLYLSYRGHVDAEINDQYASPEGSARLVDTILHHRGCGEHLPQASQVAIHRPSGKLAAVLAITSVLPSTAHIPQVAVAREFQGQGLGSAMMQHSFRSLARLGYREVSLTVTDSNAGAVRLYERLGFRTLSTFGAFIWDAAG